MRGRIPAWRFLFFMKLEPYFENKERLSLAIPNLAALPDCGPGNALLELAAGYEKKLITDLVDRPCLDLSKPGDHVLTKLGEIKAIRFLTQKALSSARETLNGTE